jgi:DNA replication licensing factor MCM4
MEQQTISIAKAGIICQLNARTAILSAANPINSKYDSKLSVVKNIRLPPSLMSRFDLIYLMLDKHNEAYDRRLANHIVSLYGSLEEAKEIHNKLVSKELLAAYISHARKKNPILHSDVMEELIKVNNLITPSYTLR